MFEPAGNKKKEPILLILFQLAHLFYVSFYFTYLKKKNTLFIKMVFIFIELAEIAWYCCMLSDE